MRWSLVAVALAALAVVMLGRVALRRTVDRLARRTALRFRSRIDRYKLARKDYVVAQLLADEEIATAVARHAAEQGTSVAATWKRVRGYVDEIVPFFNIIVYYRIGYQAARALLAMLYKVSVEYATPEAMRRVPRDAIVVYLMNHRSNADYVLVGYALSGRVAISYAVGEWARTFPLDYVFKTFGSYFIRRRYREPLYHTVLERYVQLITRQGVTQGIFPEGGLTRDGRLRPAKIGLLDYILAIARDPAYRDRLHLVPVAINYDRVLEDRSLLLELDGEGSTRPARLAQAWDVLRFVAWNAGRIVTRRWKRYGRAAVTIGEPVPVGPWLAAVEAAEGRSLFALPRPERLARVQALADDMMSRIGALIPVTPVPLACAALQSLDADFVEREALLARMAELREHLLELDGRVVHAERGIEETFDRAYRMLRMRRIVARVGTGYLVLPRGRPLVSYYANGIAHLLGPWERRVRDRDALPRLAGRGE
jgi:glycerol-3-phosphate O-acyltransferase